MSTEMMNLNCDMTIENVLEIMDKNTVDKVNNYNLWYDWFCRDEYLHTKGKKLLNKLDSIRNSTKFNNNTTYVFFKNNCPLYGDCKCYDDFRICDKESGDVLYTIIPRSPYGRAEVYGKENDFDKPLVNGTWRDIKKWFNANA